MDPLSKLISHLQLSNIVLKQLPTWESTFSLSCHGTYVIKPTPSSAVYSRVYKAFAKSKQIKKAIKALNHKHHDLKK